MFKKIVLFLIISILFLFFSIKLNQDFFIEKSDYSGIIFSDIEKIDLNNNFSNILLIKDNNNSFLFQENKKFIIDGKSNFDKQDYFTYKDLTSFYQKNTIPVVLNNNLNKNDLEAFLNNLDCDKNILLTQFNFSDHDFFNNNILNNLDNVYELNLDCPMCFYGVYYFSKKCGKDKYVFEDNDLYFKNEGESKKDYKQTLFIGDMMFDRGVEYLMQKNSFNYPFEKIKNYLNSEIIVGNLEGPIVNNPVFISAHSMTFSFDKKIAEVLKNNNFNILSLANNHTSNMGGSGLKETKIFLKENNINYAGDPSTCSINDVATKDDFIFYAINKTFDFNCSNEEISSNIKKIKENNPEKFLVIYIHWGEEYVHDASKKQIDLAHLMIDSGADLIIGGHPHVIQNIEKYDNKLIFYSLGNFIFDQYFSKETQQGLMVGIELENEKQVYSIFAIEEDKAQPYLIENQKSILDWLASISSNDLKDEIKSGKIIIHSKDQ